MTVANPNQPLATFVSVLPGNVIIPSQDKDDVGSRGSAWQRQAPKWQLINDLCGGTNVMRQAGTRWLPQERNEEFIAYLARLGRSFLYGALKAAIKKVVDKPFSAPVVLEGGDEELPDWVKAAEEDMDFAGNNLSTFSREFMESLAKYNHCTLLVDFPSTPPQTAADDKKNQRRPVFVRIDAPQVLGFKTENDPETHAPQLTEFRYEETRTEPDGKYGERQVSYVRIYTKTTWEVWKRSTADREYGFEARGEHTFGRVPVQTVYLEKPKAFMESDPPFEDLAWLNIAHWQSNSDQRNILRFARIGILMITGMTEEEYDEGVVIGPGTIIKSLNDKADGKYIEYAGKAIDAGQADLDKLEQLMETLGLQPFIARSSQSTAAGKILDESRTHSGIQTWIGNVENGLVKAFAMGAEWMKKPLPEDFAVNIFSDFDMSLTADGDVDRLSTMRQAGDLSRRTYLAEVQRRGLISEKLDIDKEIEDIEAEGPALADLLPPEDPNAPPVVDPNAPPKPKPAPKPAPEPKP